MDRHRPRRKIRRLAVAREIIGALAIDLDRRKGRRRCRIVPVKRGSGARIAARPGRAPMARDLAVGIVGVGFRAPEHGEAIGLLAVLHERHGLGRLAESDRQNARGQRVERAGVAGLLGVEQALQLRDGMGRGHADRFVEHDPAIDLGAWSGGRSSASLVVTPEGSPLSSCGALDARSRVTFGELSKASIFPQYRNFDRPGSECRARISD